MYIQSVLAISPQMKQLFADAGGWSRLDRSLCHSVCLWLTLRAGVGEMISSLTLANSACTTGHWNSVTSTKSTTPCANLQLNQPSVNPADAHSLQITSPDAALANALHIHRGDGNPRDRQYCASPTRCEASLAPPGVELSRPGGTRVFPEAAAERQRTGSRPPTGRKRVHT